MDLKHKIIQRNCRGLKSNYHEFLLLLTLLNPSVFCLQETFLKTDDKINIKDFNVYYYIYSDDQKPSGGSSIFVRFCLPQRQIKITTHLQMWQSQLLWIKKLQSVLFIYYLLFP